MSLLVTGSIGIDTVESPSGMVEDALGGSSMYFAKAASFFASAESPVRLVGVVGDDCPDGFMAPIEDDPLIDATGIEVRQGSKTFRWHGRYHADVNERDTVHVQLNVLGEAGPGIPQEFRDSRYVFLANTHPQLQLQMLDQLDSPEMVVADTMDLWINTEREGLTALMLQIDGLVLNDSEARQFTGKENVVAAGLAIADLVGRFVVVKKGEHGSILFMDGKAYPMPGYPSVKVVDPTGAGDCFAGAMMGHLAAIDKVDDRTLRTAMAYGTVTAGIELEDFSLNRLQATTREEIDSRMDEFRNLTRF